MKLSSYDALLHLGDFDYEQHPDAFFDRVLPSDRSFKFMGVLGNHDSLSENSESQFKRFRDNVYNTMKKSGIECKFSDSKFMWSCRYHNMVCFKNNNSDNDDNNNNSNSNSNNSNNNNNNNNKY